MLKGFAWLISPKPDFSNLDIQTASYKGEAQLKSFAVEEYDDDNDPDSRRRYRGKTAPTIDFFVNPFRANS